MSSSADAAHPVGRVGERFAALADREQTTVIPFVCGGHPTPEATGELIVALDGAGAQIIEVGIPFSDPIADGPVIAAAMHEVLSAGTTLETVFAEVARVRDRVDAALVAMVSVSIVHGAGGPEVFCDRARDAGFDGFIFPDAPLEESGALLEAARQRGLSVSLLVAPTTAAERAADIAAACTGFVYLLARSGITGERADTPDIGPRVADLRRATRRPIACGFGISTPEHVSAVVEHADAAIVGSALVKTIASAARSGQDAVSAAADQFTELMAGTARF
jgi:tryptophan synthase alpha chain